MSTLSTIIKDNWKWRRQIIGLARFRLKKEVSGAALGWFWIYAKRIVYIAVFWFALAVGIRSGKDIGGDGPYILWLTAGLIPWFFMQDMLSKGLDVFHKFPYLTKKMKFPLGAIPTVLTSTETFIHITLLPILLVLFFIARQGEGSIYLLQLPFAIIVMALFWNVVSTTAGFFSAISKDFRNSIKVATTPLFWLSGIIFNIHAVGIKAVEVILWFDPVAFFATWYRAIFYDHIWIWERPEACLGMIAVFIVTTAVMVLVYKRMEGDLSDVL